MIDFEKIYQLNETEEYSLTKAQSSLLKLIEDEQEAIDGYMKCINDLPRNFHRNIKDIVNDELRHKQELEDMYRNL